MRMACCTNHSDPSLCYPIKDKEAENDPIQQICTTSFSDAIHLEIRKCDCQGILIFLSFLFFSRKSMSSKNIDIRCSCGWLGVSFARVMARSIVLKERFRFQWFYHLCFGNNTSFQHPIVTKVVWWHGGLRGYCFLNGVPHAPSNYIYCQQTEDHNWWNNQTRYLVKFGIFGK